MTAAVLAASLATACGGDGSTPAGPESTSVGGLPVVVDTDLALDDLVALAFLLSSTDADVRAVTVSGTGEVRCPQGLKVIRSLLAVTGDEDVPVACGRSTPLAGDHEFPTEWRDLADSGWGLDLSEVPEPAAEVSAVDLLGTTLNEGGVTLLALGPLTNLAESFRADPGLARKVPSIVVMGGAVDVPGNVFGEGVASSTAEWNIYVDPTAAAEVLGSGAPIVLVGLDATNEVPITGDFVELLGANAHTAAAKLVDGLISTNPQVYTGEAYFWDPLAAAVVVDPGLVEIEEAAITVVTAPGPDNGRTVRREDGTVVRIAGRPRATDLEELLLRTLDGLEPGVALAERPPPVGEAVIRFAGGTCSYDGPSTVSSGRMRFTFETTDPAWTGAAVTLTGERSIEQILSWLEAHPDSRDQVPGVGQATPVAPGLAMYVDVTAPQLAAICATDGVVPLLGGTVTVTKPDSTSSGEAADPVVAMLLTPEALGEDWSTMTDPSSSIEDGIVTDEIRDQLPRFEDCPAAGGSPAQEPSVLRWEAFRQLDLATEAPSAPPDPGGPPERLHIVMVQEFLLSDDPSAVSALFEQLRAGMDDCAGRTTTSADGEQITSDRLAVPVVGEEATGLRSTVTEPRGSSSTVVWDVRAVTFYDGDVLVALTVIEITTAGVDAVLDEAAFVGIVTTAAAAIP